MSMSRRRPYELLLTKDRSGGNNRGAKIWAKVQGIYAIYVLHLFDLHTELRLTADRTRACARLI